LISEEKRVFDRKKLSHLIHQFIDIDQAHFDIWKASQRTKVYFIEDRCLRLNREEKILELEKYGKLEYERLSIECQSEPILPLMKGAHQQTIFSVGDGIKFIEKINDFIHEVQKHCPREVRIALSGQSLKSLELALSIKIRLQDYCDHIEVVLFTEEAEFFKDLSIMRRRSLKKTLKANGVRLLEAKTIEYADEHEIYFTDQSQIDFDIFIPSEKFKPTKALSRILQSKTQQIPIHPDLSFYRDHNIFVHGDCVSLTQEYGGKSIDHAEEQVEVLKKNLFREDIDDPRVDYRDVTKRPQQVLISKDKALRFFGPFSWEKSISLSRWKDKLKLDSSLDKKIEMLPYVQEEAMQNLEYETNHMSRPWKGAFSRSEEDKKQIKLLSFNGFNWWGNYAESARIITRMALLKALSQGVDLQLLRFNLTLPRKDSFWIQHIFESTFRSIENVVESYGVCIDGGDTFNGEHWHLSITVGGQRQFESKKQFNENDYVLLTKPLGFGILWSSRLQDNFDSRWIDKALNESALPSWKDFHSFVKKWNPRGLGFVEEWGFLYHGFEHIPVDQQLVINFREVPRWRGVDEMLKQQVYHPGLDTNWNRIQSEVAFSREEVSRSNSVLWDPLSQGSLMLGVDAQSWKEVLGDLKSLGFSSSALVGCIRRKQSQNKVVLSDWKAL
jgi:NADH dehydrogenase FAD-containing subunit